MDTNPPDRNIEAEAALLGSLLLHPSLLERAIDKVSAEDFQPGTHRDTYRAIKHLAHKHAGVDVPTVVGRLRETGELEQAGGAAAIASLEGEAGTIALFDSYLEQVRSATLRRKLWAYAHQAHTHAKGEDPGEGLDRCEQELGQVREWWTRDSGSGFTTSSRLSDWAIQYFGQADQTAHTPRFPFPWPTLQEQTGGWQPGELIIIGGYSGDGKSVAAGQFLKGIAEQGKRIGFWNLEMTPEQIELRLISMLTGLSASKLKQPHLMDLMERDEAIRAADTLRDMDYGIYSGGGVTSHQIRMEQKRRKYDVVVVDHIHRMPGSEDPKTLPQLVRPLKDMSLESECGCIALAQLNRDAERGFPVPNPNRLKGGNVLMEEADYVFFVHRRRDEYEAPTRDGSVVVSKVRDGLSGFRIPVVFEPEWMRFVEKTA